MNQDGTNTSLYGLCLTGVLTIASHITLNDVLTVFAILAAITTVALNVKNFFKKSK